MRKVMVFGAGDLGRRVCHELVHGAGRRRIRLVGRDGEAMHPAVNLMRFSALQRGCPSTVDYEVADLRDRDRTAEVIARFDPDVVFLAASLQSWWVISTLPPAAFARLYAANFGPWLPMHLVPVMQAMQAIRRAGSRAVVVNAAYPDAVHPALAAVGLAPHIGIGNVANNVPALRHSAGAILGIDPTAVDIRVVAHHYVSHRLSRTSDIDPSQLRIAVMDGERDLFPGIGLIPLLKPLATDYRRTGGLPGQAMTASSAMSVLDPLVDGVEALVHAPGPLGLPGGYPVTLAPGKISLALPSSMNLDEAIAVNRNGQVDDGIREISAHGLVRFDEPAMEVMHRELGYLCPAMELTEAESRAEELAARFAQYRRALP
jgi:hypothetical protein